MSIEALSWKRTLIEFGSAVIVSATALTAPTHIHQEVVLAQGSGPFDPEDSRRSSRFSSELHPYQRSDEQALDDLKGGVAGVLIVGGFVGAVYLLGRARERY